MSRTYKVGQITSTSTQVVARYFVTDANPNNKEEINTRPHAAEFPISVMYDQDLQEKRAEAFCDFMNKLEEAKKVAYDQVHLVDMLSRNP